MMESKQGEVIAASTEVDTLWVSGQGRLPGRGDM